VYFGFSAARERAANISRIGDAGAHFDRALALHEQGKLAEAIEEYRASLRIIPGSPEAHYNLGVALHAQGNRDAAITEFRKARDNAQRGSELAEQIESALAKTER
jgi:Flp pilus assembly protein TadD